MTFLPRRGPGGMKISISEAFLSEFSGDHLFVGGDAGLGLGAAGGGVGANPFEFAGEGALALGFPVFPRSEARAFFAPAREE